MSEVLLSSASDRWMAGENTNQQHIYAWNGGHFSFLLYPFHVSCFRVSRFGPPPL